MTEEELAPYGLKPKHGKLTILGYSHRTRKGVNWHVKCDCGKVTTALGPEMKRGRVKSCGCLYRQTLRSDQTCKPRLHFEEDVVRPGDPRMGTDFLVWCPDCSALISRGRMDYET